MGRVGRSWLGDFQSEKIGIILKKMLEETDQKWGWKHEFVDYQSLWLVGFAPTLLSCIGVEEEWVECERDAELMFCQEDVAERYKGKETEDAFEKVWWSATGSLRDREVGTEQQDQVAVCAGVVRR